MHPIFIVKRSEENDSTDGEIPASRVVPHMLIRHNMSATGAGAPAASALDTNTSSMILIMYKDILEDWGL